MQKHGIDVVHHLPGVGENLRDHPNVRITYECAQPITINDVLRNPLLRMKEGMRFVFHRIAPGIDELPQRTTLERAIVAHLRAGKHWRNRTGWLRI